jgi:hypothetical protein
MQNNLTKGKHAKEEYVLHAPNRQELDDLKVFEGLTDHEYVIFNQTFPNIHLIATTTKGESTN